MSLTRKGFEEAAKRAKRLNARVNKIFESLELPLNNKVQTDHYGRHYLFGKPLNEKMTNNEITEIVKETPKEHYGGWIDFFGRWTPSREEHQKREKEWNEGVEKAVKDLELFRRSLNYLYDKEYQKAWPILTELGEAGAEYYKKPAKTLAVYYRYGFGGLEKDKQKSDEWFKKAGVEDPEKHLKDIHPDYDKIIQEYGIEAAEERFLDLMLNINNPFYWQKYSLALDLALSAYKGQKDTDGADYILRIKKTAERCLGERAKIAAILYNAVDGSLLTVDGLIDAGMQSMLTGEILRALDLLKRREGESDDGYFNRIVSHNISEVAAIAIEIKFFDMLFSRDESRRLKGRQAGADVAKYDERIKKLIRIAKQENEKRKDDYRKINANTIERIEKIYNGELAAK
jgi:hypothetical protein